MGHQVRKSWLQRQVDRFRSPERDEAAPLRLCRFERMEPRRMLAADLHLGAVYYEEASGEDNDGDVFHVSFNGGAAGTQLTQLTINTDKQGDGLTNGDPFFDTASGGLGAYEHFGFQVLDLGGVGSVSAETDVDLDGQTLLILTFTGFDASDELIFTLDVDEQGFPSANAVVEGDEFQGSILEGTFSATNYFDAEATGVFVDRFDDLFDGLGLGLPDDDYSPPNDTPYPVRTAGVLASATQQALPTISGTVFLDQDRDVNQDAGDTGIEGVELSLFQFNGTTYVDTGSTATTDADGNYLFEGVAPGTYCVRETQPDGYFSVGAAAGTVDGNSVGDVMSPDEICQITLAAGDDSVENNFAEALPASFGGRVHADRDGDCAFDEGETPLEGVVIHLLDEDGERIDQTTTDADGFYSFTGLDPNIHYGVEEEQPDGYFDGEDEAGDAGGTANGDDTITGLSLFSGQQATGYDFCELEPASINGRVFADRDGDCEFTTGDVALEGVTIHLLDANGVRIDQTETDAEGRYTFDGLEPGVSYGVEEEQPSGYYDGDDEPGDAGGTANGDDTITGVVLDVAQDAGNYDFCEHEPASISGRVFADRDEDCEFTQGDVAIEGVTVYLLDANGVRIDETQTDAEGRYTFDGLEPGVSYGVEEEQPDGYFDGEDEAGDAGGTANGDDTITQVVLGVNQDATGYDFCEHEPATLSGRVFADDGDCVFEENDVPLEGVTVYLLDANGVRIQETTTDDQGRYSFSGLEPGLEYGVEEIQPEGYFDSEEEAGDAGGSVTANDIITGAVLDPGQQADGYEFCEIAPATISGFVFQDGPPIVLAEGQTVDDLDIPALRDGARTGDDAPLVGILLQLGDAGGEPVLDDLGNPITTLTDENGFYQFTGLRPGTYSIFEAQPDTLYDGQDSPGTTGGLAANHDEDLAPQFLTLTHNFDAIIFVAVAPGGTSLENNFSEVAVQPPLPPPPPPPPTNPLPPPTFPRIPAGMPGSPFSSPGLPGDPPATLYPVLYGGGAGGYSPTGFSWHLSILDAGTPRGEGTPDGTVIRGDAGNRDVFVAYAASMGQSHWQLWDETTGEPREIAFGQQGAIPVTGDFDGDGATEVAVFRDGQWFIDLNGNGVWDDEDLWAELGSQGDRPVTGDWDGDGKTDIGIFGPAWSADPRAVASEPGLPDPQNDPFGPAKNLPPRPGQATNGWRTMQRSTHGPVRSDLVDHVFYFGAATDIPIAGDWNGDGVDSIGVFSGGIWILDTNGDGRWQAGELMVDMGRPGDLPVIGDFNGDGLDELGIFRDGLWRIDMNRDWVLDATDKVFELGEAGDIPVVGDWDGDGVEEAGIYRDGVFARQARR